MELVVKFSVPISQASGLPVLADAFRLRAEKKEVVTNEVRGSNLGVPRGGSALRELVRGR